MQKPTLAIMAAGMGSRFGGLKQITPVDEQGHFIMDFSLYDARLAGFEQVVFIIKHDIEADFKAKIGRRMEKFFDVKYVYQELDCLPEGFSVPEGRTKPWGTGHAVGCLHGVVHSPFAVINADDYYGRTAIASIFDFLKEDRPAGEHAMVGYRVRNTVTESGHVARGICQSSNGFLTEVVEHTHIEKRGDDAAFTEDGVHFEHLSGDTIVSMNLWGFQEQILEEFTKRFSTFLKERLPKDPKTCEFFLPYVVETQIQEHLGTVRVLPTNEKWYGVTYREDMQTVIDMVAQKKREGIYPKELWGTSV